jgi:hypothetical protein
VPAICSELKDRGFEPNAMIPKLEVLTNLILSVTFEDKIPVSMTKINDDGLKIEDKPSSSSLASNITYLLFNPTTPALLCKQNREIKRCSIESQAAPV